MGNKNPHCGSHPDEGFYMEMYMKIQSFILMNYFMQLSKKAIDEFKRIYFQKFHVELVDEEANAKGVELLEFVKLIYHPIYKSIKEK